MYSKSSWPCGRLLAQCRTWTATWLSLSTRYSFSQILLVNPLKVATYPTKRKAGYLKPEAWPNHVELHLNRKSKSQSHLLNEKREGLQNLMNFNFSPLTFFKWNEKKSTTILWKDNNSPNRTASPVQTQSPWPPLLKTPGSTTWDSRDAQVEASQEDAQVIQELLLCFTLKTSRYLNTELEEANRYSYTHVHSNMIYSSQRQWQRVRGALTAHWWKNE